MTTRCNPTESLDTCQAILNLLLLIFSISRSVKSPRRKEQTAEAWKEHDIDISRFKQDNRKVGINLYKKPLCTEERSLSDQTAFESEIAQLLVTTLNLKISPTEIPPLDPLFGEGLGLDSIDALEIALVVHQHYGYKLRSDDPDNTTIFSSLRSLCEAIEKNRVTT